MRRIVFCLALAGVSGCSLFQKKPPESDYAVTDPATTGTATPSTNYYPTETPPAAAAALTDYGAGARYHTVQRKETLYSLARMYYNDQSKWRTIYEANRADIGTDPNKIRVGQRLVIP
jgi:nucleoid-associated protein YgaU